jgi:hypothetical protein
MYDEYEEYDHYPRRTPRKRFPPHWKWGLAVVLILSVLGFRLMPRKQAKHTEPVERRQVVKVVNWKEVDIRIRAAVEAANGEATRHAKSMVNQWMRELRERVNNDFLMWYFNYWNQQSMALKAIGYHVADLPLVEAIVGEQPTAQEQLEQLIEESFAARVLQPQSAQLRVEKITRESVEIYLLQLSDQLNGLQAEFGVSPQEWNRHLSDVSNIAFSIEGNRQVPIITKVAVAGGGVAVVKMVRAMIGHVRVLALRVAGRQTLGGGMTVGSKLIRGGSWWLAMGMAIWDAADHQRTVSQNLPVLRRSLNTYLDELEQQILHDPETGIIQTLEGVQRDVLRGIEETNK